MDAFDFRATVLVADDNPNDLIFLRRAFSRLPMVERSITVPSGEDVLAYLEGEGKYQDRTEFPLADVLFLDYRMPGLSGLAVLCWLRSNARFERIPVVIVSGTPLAVQSEMANRMAAASCPKLMDCAEMSERIVDSLRCAFRLVHHPFGQTKTHGAQRTGALLSR